MGKNIVHCGDVGTGGMLKLQPHIIILSVSHLIISFIGCVRVAGVAKLCNNLSLAISMIGTCEAMNLVSPDYLLHNLPTYSLSMKMISCMRIIIMYRV